MPPTPPRILFAPIAEIVPAMDALERAGWTVIAAHVVGAEVAVVVRVAARPTGR